MKIQTNFVTPAQQAVKPLLGLTWLALLLLLLLAAGLIADGLALRAELPQLRARVQHQPGVNAPAALAPQAEAQLAHTRERLARLQAVARTRGMPEARLLGELEALLPPQAWLTRLHYRAGEGELRLMAAAATAEPLSAFLRRLEQSALFEQVMLLREVQPGAAEAGGVQFEIRLKVRA